MLPRSLPAAKVEHFSGFVKSCMAKWTRFAPNVARRINFAGKDSDSARDLTKPDKRSEAGLGKFLLRKHVKLLNFSLMKVQTMGTVTIEFTAREYEVLALAADTWKSRVVNLYTEQEPWGYLGPRHIKEVEAILDEIVRTYEKRPF